MLSIPQHSVFLQRTHREFEDQKRRARAAGDFVDYRLEDLRAFVLNNIGARRCHYCRGPIRVDTFALDHKNPPLRGGSYAFHNLAIVCKDCVRAKGLLDYIEFKELISLLCSWSPFVRRNLLARLRAAGPIREQLYVPHRQRLLQAGVTVPEDC